MRTMYDSDRPSAIPTTVSMVAGYIDGTTGRWTDLDWERFPNATKVRIARRTSTNDGHVLDVEPGIVWPPSQAVIEWVQRRRLAGVEPTIYCNELNGWETIRQMFDRAHVAQPNYWTSRYNLKLADSPPIGAVARQYADPAVHGGGHYDLTVVRDYWPGVDPVPVPPIPLHKDTDMYFVVTAVDPDDPNNHAGVLTGNSVADMSTDTKLRAKLQKDIESGAAVEWRVPLSQWNQIPKIGVRISE